MPAAPSSSTPVAVLTSGGLDSAILLAHLARAHREATIYPLYIHSGLNWEPVELQYLRPYLEALRLRPGFSNIAPLVELQQPVLDLYKTHWSVTGQAVPDASTPDEAVYLPGRNALLTLKALLWSHLHGVNQVALGILASNPFPDAKNSFLTAFARVIGQSVNQADLQIVTPFASMHKTQVMHLGRDLPLELSFSCIRPQQGLHCGHCNKCAERKKAFRDAGMPDPTQYAR
jgi:7-cyano-7-deazaguanine synthase